MEKTFKFIFFLAIIIFCIVIIALFLLAIKIALLFFDNIIIMGIEMAKVS